MTDLWIPDVRQAQVQPRIIDKTGRFSSPVSGNVRTVKRSGTRWGFIATYASLTASERARMEPIVTWLGGAENRVLYSPGDNVQRGSFPSQELLLNNTFHQGVVGWTAGPNYSIQATDEILTAIRTANTVPSNMLSQSVIGLTPYAPVVLRAMTVEGRGIHSNIGPQINSSEVANALTPGYRQLSYTPRATSLTAGLVDFVNAGQMAGDYFSVPYMSLARCPLVDNGINQLTNSDTPGGSGWTVAAATASPNGTVCPDGSNSAYYLLETTATSAHYIATTAPISAGPRDVTFSIFVAANLRSFAWVQLFENLGNTAATAYFNLITGAVGTVTTGSNWSDVRAVAEPYGANWYRVTVTGRIKNASTSVTIQVGAAPNDGSQSYTGSTSGVAILTWRANFSASSVPARAVATAGAANGGILQSGTGLWVKGLPSNQQNLLLQGDYFEINQELKKVTAPLNSSAAGVGYLQFAPPLRFAPADNDPIVLNHPIGRFIMNQVENGWTANPGIFTDVSLDLVEAY